ncbi:putative pyridoxine 4-dehydrogenase, protein kinase RLK-Pelle-Extensin family [Helianthus anomalus]
MEYSREADEIVIATKFAAYPWCLTPNQFVNAYKSSLDRLQIDKIGIAQLHWSTANYAPLQERALWDGLVAMFDKVQFSLLSMSDDQMEINSVCDLLGIRVIAYSLLGLGMLTGKYTPANLPCGPRYEVSKGIKENSFYSLKILDQCSPIHLNLVVFLLAFLIFSISRRCWEAGLLSWLIVTYSAGVSYCCSVWHGDAFLKFLLRFQIFTFKQLLSATGGFGKSNVIGQGGFGSVYRGVLQDGRKIVVKLMDQAGKQGEEEFRVEVEMLSRLCSPYLLALIGYCLESHHRVLVYDFLANGGLQEHLYPIKGM